MHRDSVKLCLIFVMLVFSVRGLADITHVVNWENITPWFCWTKCHCGHLETRGSVSFCSFDKSDNFDKSPCWLSQLGHQCWTIFILFWCVKDAGVLWSCQSRTLLCMFKWKRQLFSCMSTVDTWFSPMKNRRGEKAWLESQKVFQSSVCPLPSGWEVTGLVSVSSRLKRMEHSAVLFAPWPLAASSVWRMLRAVDGSKVDLSITSGWSSNFSLNGNESFCCSESELHEQWMFGDQCSSQQRLVQHNDALT